MILCQFLQDPDEEIAKIDRTVRSQCGSQVGSLADWDSVEGLLLFLGRGSHIAVPLGEGFFPMAEHHACQWALTSASLGIPGRSCVPNMC